MSDELYGWYEPEQAERVGTVVYRHEEGREVHCSEVTDTPERAEAGYNSRPSATYLGKLVEWLRKGRPASSLGGVTIQGGSDLAYRFYP